jgi:hypothetical protein
MRLRTEQTTSFVVGWNVPWYGYGHDVGENAWGHDGFSTNGWTRETYVDSQGFTDVELAPIGVCSGRGVLRISTNIVGGHPNRASGEVHVHLGDHLPGLCVPVGASPALNLSNAIARCRLVLPAGSAGSASAPNGIQFVFKTRVSDSVWPSLHTTWQNISPSWEGRCVDLTARVNPAEAAHVDSGFDAGSITLAGLKVGANSQAAAQLQGIIEVESYALDGPASASFSFTESEIGRHFADVRNATSGSLGVARVFLFGDGRASPEFDASGNVTGFDAKVSRDLDTLLEAASKSGVQLIPVLWDFSLSSRRTIVSGVPLGGRADLIRRPESFLAAFAQLLQRYGSHPAVLAWEVINEPEWMLRENADRLPDTEVDAVSLAEMRAFVGACATLVHRHSRHQVTVGSARHTWATWWKDLDLDFYQIHWYDHFTTTEPFPWRPAAALGLDRPCLIGEVPLQQTRHAPADYIAAAQAGGYSGVLFWSCRARDAFSGL